MPKTPKYIEKLHQLIRSEPTPQQIENIENELYLSSSDRAAAIMWSSFLEVGLERLLACMLRSDLSPDDRKNVFGFGGALNSFSSKIVMAYALKLIGPQTRFDFDQIKFLRNVFAHSWTSISFETPEVSAVCDQLKMPDTPQTYVPQAYLSKLPESQRAAASDINHPKTRFITTCHTIAYRMLIANRGVRPGDSVFPDDEPLP